MALTVFLALCILGIDFMVYVLFQWTYGDKRDALTRQIAARRNALKEQSPRALIVASQEAAPGSPQSDWRAGTRPQRTWGSRSRSLLEGVAHKRTASSEVSRPFQRIVRFHQRFQ